MFLQGHMVGEYQIQSLDSDLLFSKVTAGNKLQCQTLSGEMVKVAQGPLKPLPAQ